jgi:hypothetical protein
MRRWGWLVVIGAIGCGGKSGSSNAPPDASSSRMDATAPDAAPEGSAPEEGNLEGSDGGDASQIVSEDAAPPSKLGIGCVPAIESLASFEGFSSTEVSIDLSGDQCGQGVPCIVNHFQGRVDCPYGQQIDGGPLTGDAGGCLAASTMAGTTSPTPVPVTQAVRPWCVTRPPENAVYCSCRCANADGRTDDGQTYCACPASFSCQQLVPPIKPQDTSAGAYCIKGGTTYAPEATLGCMMCNATMQNCAPAGLADPASYVDGQTQTYFTLSLATSPGLCYPTPLPAVSSGLLPCRMFETLPASETCGGPGLTLVTGALANYVDRTGSSTVCELQQLPAASDPSEACTASATAGWCLLTGAAAGNCAQTIAFSPSGRPPVQFPPTFVCW